MRVIIQRVREAVVTVGERVTGQIEQGLVIFLAVAKEDGASEAKELARRVSQLRVFEDERGRMAHSVAEINGSVLVVPQFTLLADLSRGRRPSFDHAAPPEQARVLCEAFVAAVQAQRLHVETGEFGTKMRVTLQNDGPATFLLDVSPPV